MNAFMFLFMLSFFFFFLAWAYSTCLVCLLNIPPLSKGTLYVRGPPKCWRYDSVYPCTPRNWRGLGQPPFTSGTEAHGRCSPGHTFPTTIAWETGFLSRIFYFSYVFLSNTRKIGFQNYFRIVQFETACNCHRFESSHALKLSLHWTLDHLFIWNLGLFFILFYQL